MNLRLRLKEPELFLTMFSIIPSLEIVEMAAIAGMDGIILDTEHSSYGTESLPALISAARGRNIYPIVRVRQNESSLIAAALDAGAAGVLVPQVSSVEDAKSAIRAARFAPHGTRGANPWVRAADYGGSKQWFETANEQIAILLLVEGLDGVRSLNDILSLPDLDLIFLGPVDLSHALGVPGEVEHPTVQATISDAMHIAAKRGIRTGVFTPYPAKAREWSERGIGFVAVGIDTMFVRSAFERVVQEVRTRVNIAERISR